MNCVVLFVGEDLDSVSAVYKLSANIYKLAC